ncbi:Scr1 family TA system antitoxin-like transcriptional regulator [Kitasatospora sp. NPDC059812]|uniref:Scr1 family TA system antitoxin-like transcriptional regulator n=1 Tax=unclassified Kitasatospora TaxID=2633591 RepID=UPI00364C3676
MFRGDSDRKARWAGRPDSPWWCSFEKLEQQYERGNVVLQVAPFSMGEHRPFVSPVRLLTLPDGSLFGYSESEGRGHVERDDVRLLDWRRRYDRLQVGALAELATLELIRAAWKDSHG